MIGLLSALLAITFVSAAPTESVSAEPSTESLFPLCNNPTSRTDSCKLVDPKIYVEHPWYEQGRSWMIRNTFERHSACVTASYSFKPDGNNIKILNRAVNEDDKNNTVQSVEGNAEIFSESQFKVRFGDQSTGGKIGLWFQNLAKGPNYFILNVWTDGSSTTAPYKLALVTNGKKLLDITTDIWILSDSPSSISDNDMKMVLDYAEKAGYNPKKSIFERTPCTETQRALLDM